MYLHLPAAANEHEPLNSGPDALKSSREYGYADMEQLVLMDADFVLKPDLANALAQAKKLSVLVLDVSYCELGAIRDIMNTSKSLSVFHIYPDKNSVFSVNRKRAGMFAKSLREIAAECGRVVDMEIIHCGSPLTRNEVKKWFPHRYFPHRY